MEKAVRIENPVRKERRHNLALLDLQRRDAGTRIFIRKEHRGELHRSN